MNINCEHAAQLVDILARPVSPEVLKAWGTSPECEEEFQDATQLFNGNDYRNARDHYCRAHQLMGLSKERSSAALRNASLCLYHLGQCEDAFDEMLPWFHARSLHGSALWNFAIAAIRAEKYETGVEALTQWKERAVEYLLPRASVLGAAILGCLGRNPEAGDWLQQGLEADSSYVNARLRQIGLVGTETKAAVYVVDSSSRETLRTRLMTLLTPSKPQRYPHLHSLPPSDFQAASRAIDLARDDDVSNALDTLGNLAGSGRGQDARIWIEATIRLQMGEAAKAEALIASVAQSTPMPGSVWWNWAATASARDAYQECVDRLLRCVTTEYSLKAEAWGALLVAAMLASDLDAAKKAAGKCHLLSDRSRSLMLSIFDGLPEAATEAAGISAQLANARPQAEPEIDTEALKAALQQKNLQRAVEVLKKPAVTSVRDLPEYEAAPLEPDLITEVPRAVIRHDMQGDFRKGLALLLSGDPAGAEGIFRALSERVPYCWQISVNLACALYRAGNYSEALEILEDRYATSPDVWQAANATSVLAARVALEKFGDAQALLLKERAQLGESRFHLYEAVLAEIQKRPRDLAEALFELSRAISEPTLALLGLCAVRCAEAKDWNRVRKVVEAAVSGRSVRPTTPGVTAISLSPRDCKTHKQMEMAFDRFAKDGDWRAAIGFFAAVETIQETLFYGSMEDKSLVALLNARVQLGRALARSGKLRAADTMFRGMLQLMEDHRNRLYPAVEAALGLLIADGYAAMEAPFRQRDALSLAERATPDQPAIIDAARSCRLPVLDRVLLGMATTDLAEQINLLGDSWGMTELEAVRRAMKELWSAMSNIDTVAHGEKVLDFLRRVRIDGGSASEQETRAAATALDRVLLTTILHLPIEESEVAIEALSTLEVHLQEAIEEARQSVCTVTAVQAHHDLTNATLLLECVSRARHGLGPIHLTLGKIRDLQPVAAAKAAVAIEWLLPGQREDVFVRFGITRNWTPSERTKFHIGIDVNDQKGRQRKYSKEVTLEFRLFEEPNINYPGGAIGPEDVDGRPLYGRQDIVTRISTSLAVRRQSRLYFLFGPRKVGKTSILKFVSDEIRKRSPTHLCALINLDRGWPGGSPVKHIASDIVRAARRDFRFQDENLSAQLPTTMGEFSDWLEMLKQACQISHFVLMLDEFGKLVEFLCEEKQGGSLLGDLRHLWSGVRSISLLVADWHSREELSELVPAQFWADLDVLHITFLDESAARQAVRGPTVGTPVRFTDATRQIYYLTQGYPWHLQEMCDLALREATRNLRTVVIRADVDGAADQLVGDPRTFRQGLFKPDRISPAEETVLWKFCRYLESEFKPLPLTLLHTTWPQLPPETATPLIQKLCQNRLLTVSSDGVRGGLCSPLVLRWLQRQFENGVRVSSGPREGPMLARLAGCVLEDDPDRQVSELVTSLFDSKLRLRELCSIRNVHYPFKALDYTNEKSVAGKGITSMQGWDAVLGSLKQILLEDLSVRLDQLKGGPFNTLASAIDDLRLRRNFIEHRESPTKGAASVELRHRLLDLAHDEPRNQEDWTRMQVGLLERLRRAFDCQLAELASAVT